MRASLSDSSVGSNTKTENSLQVSQSVVLESYDCEFFSAERVGEAEAQFEFSSCK